MGSSVKGQYNVQQALTVLLSNSGLEGELSDKKAFLIKPLSPNTNDNKALRNKQVKTQKTILASIFTMLFSTASVAEEVKKQSAEMNLTMKWFTPFASKEMLLHLRCLEKAPTQYAWVNPIIIDCLKEFQLCQKVAREHWKCHFKISSRGGSGLES